MVADRQGNPALMAYPVRAALETERNKAIALTEQEAERLRKGEVIQKAVDVNGEKTRQYLQLDPETKSVIHRRVTEIRLEQKLKATSSWARSRSNRYVTASPWNST